MSSAGTQQLAGTSDEEFEIIVGDVRYLLVPNQRVG